MSKSVYFAQCGPYVQVGTSGDVSARLGAG
jgi:hypothetical protein